MVNTRKLRGKIVEKGLTYAGVAGMLGMSSCTFGRKIRNLSDMSISEAETLIDILEISREDMMDYFFAADDES